MKKSVLLAASLVSGGLVVSPVLPLRAQEAPAQVQPTFPTFAAARDAGEKLLAERKFKDSRAAFTAAVTLGKTPVEKADALTGIARTHEKELVVEEIKSGKSAVRRRTYTDYPAARLRYEEIEKLPDLPADKVAEARLAHANTFMLEAAYTAAREAFTKLIASEGLPPGVLAAAYTARAHTHLKGIFVSGQDFNAAVGDVDQALKLEGVPDAPKAEALLLRADLHGRASQATPALANFKTVIELPGATGDQKARALMMTGNYHMRDKAPERARLAWAQIPLLMGASTADKLEAHRNVAYVYAGDKKTALAAAELEKAAQLPDLTVFQKAELYETSGDIFLNAGDFAGARTAYAKVVALPDAGPTRHKDAILKTGHSYMQEKNPAKAREEWEKLAARKDTNAVDGLRQIALSYAGEQNYPAARAALERWTLVPVDLYWKEDAWIMLGQIYDRESNWTAARESFQKLIPETKARPSRRVHAVLGIIRTYEAEKNLEAAQQSFDLLPAAFAIMGQLSPAEANELTQIRISLVGQLGKLAAERGKEKATLPSALSFYRIIEKIQFAETDKLEATLAIADLLLTHGMQAEAKVEYQKVYNSSRASNAQLQRARTNLKVIEDKEKAAAGQ